jgi:hypothetical protein
MIACQQNRAVCFQEFGLIDNDSPAPDKHSQAGQKFKKWIEQ